jgi:hypothetical protein
MSTLYLRIWETLSLFRVLKYLDFQIIIILTDGILHCPLAFVLAEVGPCRLNARNIALIDSCYVGLAEFNEHLSSDELAIKHFRLYSFEDAGAQACHLSQEFWSQTFIWELL